MKFTAQVLSAEEQIRVHEESLRILSEVGVQFLGEKAIPMLKKHGVKVDDDKKIAHIPAELVSEALGESPGNFILGARNPQYNFTLPSAVTRYCIDGTAAFTRDYSSGERRYGTLKDIEDSLRIFQQMDMGVMAWAPTTASDTPARSRALHEFFTMMRFSSKHGEHEIHFSNQVPYLIAGLETVLGSKAQVRAQKNYSLIYCPVAPLMHDGEMLDAYIALGELEMPVMIMPMPATGSTGPASLFGNICQSNAEALSTIVIFQIANPGRPLIYSNATGTMDFRNGAYLGGSPEMGVMAAALVQMGHYYHLPVSSAGCTADAKQTGPEAILEKMMTTLPPVCAGADIIIGFGEMESDQLLVFEQIVVDNELAHYCERIFSGVDSSPSMDLFDDIAQVGPGGNFLKSRHTRQIARSAEFYYPSLSDHPTHQTWLDLGSPTIYSRAREKVDEILALPLADPLPESVSRELDEILSSADKELGD